MRRSRCPSSRRCCASCRCCACARCSGRRPRPNLVHMWRQRQITLEPRPRGFHLVGREIAAGMPEMADIGIGLLHLHLLHTSASLALNENASPDVREDLESWFNDAVREDAPYWEHT